MPLSNSVVHSYTPPTCTLEVVAHSSPLSRWMGRPVLKQLQFELRFDDPRLPESERIMIRGDRDQLEALHAAVTNYVQNLLTQSPENFYTNLSGLAVPSNGSYSEQLGDFNDGSGATLALHPSGPQHLGARQIYLQPGERLTHDLFVGSLVRTSPEPVIHLSILQLFDLVTALEEYAADVVALPAITHRQFTPAAVPPWAGIAAAVVLVVGAVPFTIQFVNPQKKQVQTASSSPNPQPPQPQQSILQPSPGQDLANLSPSLSPPDSLPTPPPGITSGVPSPESTFPVAPLTPGSVLSVPSTSNPSGISGQTGQSSLSINPLTQNTKPQTKNGTASTFSPSTKPGSQIALGSPSGSVQFGQNQNIMQIPVNGTTPQGTKPLSGSNQQPQTKPQTKPEIQTQITSKTPPKLGEPKFDPNFIPSPSFESGSTPLPTFNPAPNPSSETALVPAPTTPNSSLPPITESNPSDSVTAALSRRDRGTSNPGDKPANSPSDPTTTARASESRATLFDTTPQVKEAREFFERKWKPPAGLAQNLQYSLVLDVDGSVKEIMPLGQASRDYVDRSGIPLIGEKFVSPNRSGKSSRIRIVLGSDGDVTVVAEPE